MADLNDAATAPVFKLTLLPPPPALPANAATPPGHAAALAHPPASGDATAAPFKAAIPAAASADSEPPSLLESAAPAAREVAAIPAASMLAAVTADPPGTKRAVATELAAMSKRAGSPASVTFAMPPAPAVSATTLPVFAMPVDRAGSAVPSGVQNSPPLAALHPTGASATAAASANDQPQRDTSGTTGPVFVSQWALLGTGAPVTSRLPDQPPSTKGPLTGQPAATPGEPGFSIDSRLLGPVSAAVTPLNGAGDRLHVQFTVDRLATAALISGGSDRLDLTLRATGLRLETIAVAVDPRAGAALPQPDTRPPPSAVPQPLALQAASGSPSAPALSGGPADALPNPGSRDPRSQPEQSPRRETRPAAVAELGAPPRDRFA